MTRLTGLLQIHKHSGTAFHAYIPWNGAVRQPQEYTWTPRMCLPSLTHPPSRPRMCNMQCDQHTCSATGIRSMQRCSGSPDGCTRVSPGRPDAKVKGLAGVADAHHVDVRCSSRDTIQRPDLHVSPRSIYHTVAALVLLSAWSLCKLEHSSRTGSNLYIFVLRSGSKNGRLPSILHLT